MSAETQGYTQNPTSGYWQKNSDQSGPYVFDGSTFTLAAGGGSGGVASSVTIANGGDVALGATADAAVAAGAAGTLLAKVRFLTAMQQASAATTTPIAASETVVTLLAANANRKGMVVYNDTTLGVLKIKFGAAATGSDFTIVLDPGDTYESSMPPYTGLVTGIWSDADGFARVTEM